MDTTNRNTALASAFVEELARCGVRYAVLSPGSRSTPLALALHRHATIELRVIVDERSAGFFALGAAQATGTPVAMLCTSGTAAANLHPAVCEADESAVPLLLLTADRPPELRGIGAGQTIDQLKLYGSAVRWFCEVGTHEADDDGLLHMRSTACRAVAAAGGDPRPGPVHLNLSWREPLAPLPAPDQVTANDPLALEGRSPVQPLTAIASSPPTLAEPVLEELAGHLAGQPRGLIVAGRHPRVDLREPLARLARATGYPILAEPTSQLRVGPHDRELVIGCYDAIARLRPPALAPDLILRFGEMPTSKALRTWIAELEAPQLAVGPDGGWNEPSRRAAAMVRADPAWLASELAERVSMSPAPDWSGAWADTDRAVREAIEAALADEVESSEPGLQLALGAAQRDGDLVYTGSSMPIRDQEAFLPPGPADVLHLCNRGANGIDGLVSSGIGAAWASGRPATIVTGELGMLHDLGALAALDGVAAPVRIVVIDNGGGRIFDFLPQAELLPAEEMEALFLTPRTLDLSSAARAFAVAYTRISGLDELGAALDSGTGVIEVPVDGSRNTELHARLREAAQRASGSRVT